MASLEPGTSGRLLRKMQQPTTRQSMQCAGAVFMIEPASFAFNEQTAASNAMQRPQETRPDGQSLVLTARSESQRLRRALESEGVRVMMGADTALPHKPDALFPNNWISFHDDGTLVLYPMLAPNRRLERRLDLVEEVCAGLNVRPRRRLDFTAHTATGDFPDGTSSLGLAHVARVSHAR